MVTGRWDKGLPDGQWEWKGEDGENYLQLQFDRGRMVKASNKLIDARLTEVIALNSSDDPFLLPSVFVLIHTGFAETSLSDVVSYLATISNVRIAI